MLTEERETGALVTQFVVVHEARGTYLVNDEGEEETKQMFHRLENVLDGYHKRLCRNALFVNDRSKPVGTAKIIGREMGRNIPLKYPGCLKTTNKASELSLHNIRKLSKALKMSIRYGGDGGIPLVVLWEEHAKILPAQMVGEETQLSASKCVLEPSHALCLVLVEEEYHEGVLRVIHVTPSSVVFDRAVALIEQK